MRSIWVLLVVTFASPAWAEMPTMGTVASLDIVSGIVYKCESKGKQLECQFNQFWSNDEGGTCGIKLHSFSQSFEYESDNSWVAREVLGDRCLSEITARFVMERPLFWNYTTEKIVRDPEAKDLFGNSCRDKAYSRKTFEWHSKSWDIKCRRIGFE